MILCHFRRYDSNTFFGKIDGRLNVLNANTSVDR